MALHTEYDEQTFRALLDLEHRRRLQSGHAFHVLLCRPSTQDGAHFRMDESVMRALISAMRESLCKTDHLGWFLQDLVLGVLLLGNDPTRSSISTNDGTSRVRRLTETRLSLAHPSLVLQFYDYIDLPPIQQCHGSHATTRTFVR